jgi:hypothetical protein
VSNNDLLVGLVLDQSGSMWAHRDASIQGVNAFFEEQLKEEGQTLLTLTLFDTRFDARYVARDLREVPALGSKENPFSPDGGTALYDGVAITIKGIEQWLENHPDFEGEVMIAIWTDGGENSSRSWRINDLNDLIRWKQNVDNWKFVFLGAGGSAWTEGSKFTSIAPEFRVNIVATPDSYYNNAMALAANSSALRTGGGWSAKNYSRAAEGDDAS